MFFNTNDITLYYEKYGDNDKTILILPGWGNTRCTFKDLITVLKKDYTVYIFDYPGFGNSPLPNKTLDIYDYANAIRSFMKNENIYNPMVIAHSFGGRIVAVLAGYYKVSLEKVIMIDVAGIKPKKTLKKWLKEKIYKFLKAFRKLLPPLKREAYVQRLIKVFGSSDYQVLNPIMYNTFKNIINKDLKYYFKYINSKVLILWGKKDKDTPLKDAIKIKKLVKNAHLIIFPNCGHFLYLDSPLVAINVIQEFFLQEKNN